MDKNQRKEPPFKLVNGKKLYNLRFEVTHGLPAAKERVIEKPDKTAMQNEQGNLDGGDAAISSGESDQVDPNLLVVRDRVLSAVLTWSGTWYGPQLVDNGANNAFALRKMVPAINQRLQARKAVPVVWDHSLEAKDICGRLSQGSWEDSTDIPPGVNADMELPRSVDQRAVHALETGLINSTSVWWQPTSERSHPDMDFWEFTEKQGQTIDGKLVCWIPTDLEDKELIHHALVWSGADPYSGPREERGMQNAAQAARHTHSEGDRGMEEQLRKLLETLCNGLGINVALGPGSSIPEGLENRALDGITALRNVQGQYNELAAKLQGLSNALLKEGETTLSAIDVVNRLPERLESAKLGDAFLQHQQKEATDWFDRAHGDPTKQNTLTDAQKLLRESISNSKDLKFLEASIAENTRIAKERFGPGMTNRVSQGEELQPGLDKGQSMTAEERRVAASYDSVYGRRSE